MNVTMAMAAGRPDGVAAHLPSGWTADPIPAGLVVYDRPPGPAVRAELERVPHDPDRPVLAVHGSGRSVLEAAGAAVEPLIARARPDLGGGLRPVRLLLPELGSRTAQRLAERHSLDLAATSGLLKIHPHSVVAWGFSENKPGVYWQWHRYLPGRRPQSMGAIYPSPRWDTALAGAGDTIPLHGRAPGLVVGRVAAGLTLYPADTDAADFLRGAGGLQPDPDRLTVAVAPAVDVGAVLEALGALVEVLPADAARGLRLAWPGAMSPSARAGLADLCRRLSIEIVAPDTTLFQDPESGALLAWGARGLGTWLRLTPSGGAETLGALHPVPDWQPSVRTMLMRYAGTAILEEVPAGLRLHRPSGPTTEHLLPAVPPDPGRATLFVDGDAANPADRAVLEGIIESLPEPLTGTFRLIMHRAAAGGPRAYGQWLANRLGIRVTVANTFSGDEPGHHAASISTEHPTAQWLDFAPERHPLFPPNRFLAAGLPAPAPAPASSPAPAPAPMPPPAPAPPPKPVRAAAEEAVLPHPEDEHVAGRSMAFRPTETAVTVPPPVPPPLTSVDMQLIRVPEVAQAIAQVPVTVPEEPSSETEPEWVRIVLEIHRGYRSTEEERRRFRDTGGTTCERHLAAVGRLLTERPALRGALSDEPGSTATIDLSALRAYLSGDLPDLDAALRSGELGDLRPEAACAVSGLRYLAADRGPVYFTAEVSGAEAETYAPGLTLLEPGFIRATSRPPTRTGATLFSIMSRTARRVGPLTDGDPGGVVFAAGTRFTVLAVDPAGERGRVVHLDERVRPDEGLTAIDQELLERLRDAVAAHPDEPGANAPRVAGIAVGLAGPGRCYCAA
ncbi:hypothetical protein [Actinomadura sp. 6N118]|uniref:hypothetical protein n=1 Tax=Actinomadura sp. 6N118 TaxID=3375151 RepID=UPI00379D66E5